MQDNNRNNYQKPAVGFPTHEEIMAHFQPRTSQGPQGPTVTIHESTLRHMPELGIPGLGITNPAMAPPPPLPNAPPQPPPKPQQLHGNKPPWQYLINRVDHLQSHYRALLENEKFKALAVEADNSNIRLLNLGRHLNVEVEPLHDLRTGKVIDGFPRTIAQLLTETDSNIEEIALALDISFPEGEGLYYQHARIHMLKEMIRRKVVGYN